MASAADANADPLSLLQAATRDYVLKERDRLTNEATALEKILMARTGGQGIQQINTKLVAAVAYRDVASYLAGKK